MKKKNFLIMTLLTLTVAHGQTKIVPYKGGAATMERWMNEELRYPVVALENGTQATVEVFFRVQESGKVSDVQVLDQRGWGFDEEAIRLVRQMPPAWMPEAKGNKQHILILQFRCVKNRGNLIIKSYLQKGTHTKQRIRKHNITHTERIGGFNSSNFGMEFDNYMITLFESV